MRRVGTIFSTRVAVATAAFIIAASTGCSALGSGNEHAAEEAAALRDHRARLEAFAVAVSSVPEDLPPLAVEGIRVCGTVRCDDGEFGNTVVISDIESQLESNQEFLDALEKGKRNDFNLGYMRDEGHFEALPKTAYFGYPRVESVATYEGDSNGHWHGSVALWDIERGSWVGAVRVALDGPDPGVIVTDVELHADGSQTLTYVDDESGDKQRAQRKLDHTVHLAQRIALERGEDVTRPEQALRGPPTSLPRELDADAVIFVGRDAGTAKIASGGEIWDPGYDEVTDVYATGRGVLFERAVNALPEGMADMVFLERQKVYDARFWGGWTASRSAFVRQKGDQIVVFDNDAVEADDSRLRTVGHAARWQDGAWAHVDTSSAKGQRVADIGFGESGAVLLASDGHKGSVLHRQVGDTWSTLPMQGRPSAVAPHGLHTLVGTDEGLWLVAEDGAVERLDKRSTLQLIPFDKGSVAKVRRKPSSRELKFLRVVGGVVTDTGLDPSSFAKYTVGRDGTVATVDDGKGKVAKPGEPIVSFDVPGGSASLDFDAKGRLWMGTDQGAWCWSKDTLSEIQLDAVPQLGKGIRIVHAIGDGVDPGPLRMAKTTAQ